MTLYKIELDPQLNQIKKDNMIFGIQTEFYHNDNRHDVGYTVGNIIFLNASCEDVLIVNTHELLHHYEGTPIFESVKTEILNTFEKNDLEELRKLYELKYYGLYSESEIANGIMYDEIAIDFLCLNINLTKEQNQLAYDNLIKVLSSGQSITYIDAKRYNKNIASAEKEEDFCK